MINEEIARGNQSALDKHIAAYNARPDRSTPKIKYTDVVNEALARLLSTRASGADRTEAPARKGK